MGDTNEQRNRPVGTDAAEQLSALNTRVKRRNDPAQRLRRRMEASIEAGARKRRGKETAASSSIHHSS